jgi:hypothetical protein
MSLFDSPEEKLQKMKRHMDYDRYSREQEIQGLQSKFQREAHDLSEGLSATYDELAEMRDVDVAIETKVDELNARLNHFIRTFARELRLIGRKHGQEDC